MRRCAVLRRIFLVRDARQFGFDSFNGWRHVRMAYVLAQRARRCDGGTRQGASADAHLACHPSFSRRALSSLLNSIHYYAVTIDMVSCGLTS